MLTDKETKIYVNVTNEDGELIDRVELEVPLNHDKLLIELIHQNRDASARADEMIRLRPKLR